MSRPLRVTLVGVMLGVTLCTGSLAGAATTLEFTPFSITYAGIPGPAPDISLAAATPLTYSISLDTMNLDLGNFPADDGTGAGVVNGGGHVGVLEISVHDGYRVTGLTIHALGYGELLAGQLLDGPGSADNRAQLAWSLTAPGTVLPFSWQVEDLNGFAPLALGTTTLSLDGTLRIDLAASTWAQAFGLDPTPSHALASIGSALLNVQVAAIPEPGTWGMLLAGLGVVGALARRRQG
jgi:hypothetical protein